MLLRRSRKQRGAKLYLLACDALPSFVASYSQSHSVSARAIRTCIFRYPFFFDLLWTKFFQFGHLEQGISRGHTPMQMRWLWYLSTYHARRNDPKISNVSDCCSYSGHLLFSLGFRWNRGKLERSSRILTECIWHRDNLSR